MGTILLVVFLLVIMMYAVAILLKHGKEYQDNRFYFTRQEREELAQQIEKVEVPELDCWVKKIDSVDKPNSIDHNEQDLECD